MLAAIPCEKSSLLSDAVTALEKGGGSVSGLDGISILSPGCWPKFGDHTPLSTTTIADLSGTSLGAFQTAYDFECDQDATYYAPPGKSGVW